MLSTIASLFWGTKTTPTSLDSEINAGVKDDVAVDVIADEVTESAFTPLPHQTKGYVLTPLSDPSSNVVFSTSSLSDEEAGWVFVNKKSSPSELTESKPVEKEREPIIKETSRRTDAILKNIKSTPIISPSAFHASSILSALAELRPHQKAEQRHKQSRLKHKQMERSNKAMNVSSSSNRPNRRRFMYSPELCSRAVNNRKC